MSNPTCLATPRELAQVAARAAVRLSRAQANLRRAAADVQDTLDLIVTERAHLRRVRDEVAAAVVDGRLDDADVASVTADFVATQIDRLYAEPAMRTYLAAREELEVAHEGHVLAQGQLSLA